MIVSTSGMRTVAGASVAANVTIVRQRNVIASLRGLRSCAFLAAVLMAIAKPVGAQAIATTPQAAEQEGAAFPRRAAPAKPSVFFSREFSGTAERKCVTATPPVAGGSLRSGEFIIRSSLLSPATQRPPFGYKILWVPAHNPFELRDTLLIRGARLASPSDSLRQKVVDPAYQPGAPNETAGFPSLVNFPIGGRWLVVAKAGPDWGCFVLGVI